MNRVFVGVLVLGLVGFGGVVAAKATESDRLRASAAESGLSSAALDVEKMACRGCRASVRGALEKMDGVGAFTLDRKGATLAFDPARTDPERIAGTVFEATGFRASVRAEATD